MRPPHELTPAFYGCLDWHSDVHGHWLLVRLLRLFPAAPFAAQARAQLARSFTAANISGELAYLQAPGRASFERPYGLAWLLQLAAELRAWNDPEARALARDTGAARERGCRAPQRAGCRSCTTRSASASTTRPPSPSVSIWDWAAVAQDAPMRELLRDAAQRFYLHDRNCPLSYEPSGEDFLSPCLAEADFMRRVLGPQQFARWLSGFLPQIPHAAQRAAWLPPGVVTDRADPKLAHIDGLNLSRAWMLEGIAHGLPAGDPRRRGAAGRRPGHTPRRRCPP